MSALERLATRWRQEGGPLRILSASGQLGYGIPSASFEAGLARRPHVIGCDMGSIDPGPYYLGSGEMAPSPALARRDLALVLRGARALDVPLVIGSAGTAGAAPHLAATLALVREIARTDGLRFRLASIRADLDADEVLAARAAGRLRPLAPMAEPDEAAVRGSRIVAQMGTEAVMRALEAGADVVVAGRACDTAIFAAVPAVLGLPVGPAMHLAKIVECTSLCCVPGGRDAMLGELHGDGFVLESMHPERHATPVSVAAHALYEQDDPFTVHEPDGVLDLSEAHYEAVDGHRTRVSGARWTPSARPTIKVEGALREGERVVLVAAAADPAFITHAETILAAVEETTRGVIEAPFSLYPRIYGKGGALLGGPAPTAEPAEIALFIECVAPTQEMARGALAVFRQHLLHHGFAGRLATGGNLAFPLTPPEFDAGPAYRFSLYHLMEVDALAPLFPLALEDV